MKRYLVVKHLHKRNGAARLRQQTVLSAPDELKATVYEGLVAMNMAEREEFIQTLEAEMRSAGLSMRTYLVPLGIPAHSPQDLTPTEVGHLIRFLKINIPQATATVQKVMSRFNVFAEKTQHNHNRLAA